MLIYVIMSAKLARGSYLTLRNPVYKVRGYMANIKKAKKAKEAKKPDINWNREFDKAVRKQVKKEMKLNKKEMKLKKKSEKRLNRKLDTTLGILAISLCIVSSALDVVLQRKNKKNK